ncbi:DUF4148 domain-containing protein [Paraburkholderia bryophila]|uniref:DUF4148 domain-containing protein n=1 Tax=Paraburkholderia bryophila TaxID=420952 RepID=UPI002349B6C6|nr:DUF4148 domain-containing protein [Paraburkholderia bryophila]WCM22195.1 DUF4148 domain-containing protein [Paraburkholderia bryophila]
MKKIAFAALSVAILATSSGAFAQAKTRAQVYQELITAQQNGLNYVTDTSYPEVNPIFAQQVEQHKQALAAEAARAADTGGVASGTAESGRAN